MLGSRAFRLRHAVHTALLCLVAALCVLGPGPSEARDKTDLIRMDQGDLITVEIKELQKGKLSCKTHSMGTVSIDWEEIVEIQSNYYFRVVSGDGRLVFGSISVGLPEAEADSTQETDSVPNFLPFHERTLFVGAGTMVLEFPMHEVVEITAIEKGFFSRIDGSLTFGFSFAKVSDVAELTLDWRNLYREERNRITLDAITAVTQQGTEDEPRRRLDYSAGYTRRLVHSWSAGATVGFQRNDQLGLRARYIGALGAGYYPIYSSVSYLSTLLGLALNVEQGGDAGADVVTNLELQIGGKYLLYLYNSPKTDLNIAADGFVGLTERDRYRLNFEIKGRRELIKDFYFDLTYYFNWDNRNPTTGTESTDWGITTGISWTY